MLPSALPGTSTRSGPHATDILLGVSRQPDQSAGTLSVSDGGGMQHIMVQDAAPQRLLKRMPSVLLQCDVSGGDCCVVTGWC